MKFNQISIKIFTWGII